MKTLLKGFAPANTIARSGSCSAPNCKASLAGKAAPPRPAKGNGQLGPCTTVWPSLEKSGPTPARCGYSFPSRVRSPRPSGSRLAARHRTARDPSRHRGRGGQSVDAAGPPRTSGSLGFDPLSLPSCAGALRVVPAPIVRYRVGVGDGDFRRMDDNTMKLL